MSLMRTSALRVESFVAVATQIQPSSSLSFDDWGDVMYCQFERLEDPTARFAATPKRLVAVGQHVDWQSINHVGNDAAQLPVNLRLIDTKPLGEPRLVLAIQSLDVVPGQVADSFVVTANMASDVKEGVPQALCLDVLHAPDRHSGSLLNTAQGLNEGSAALPALVPLSVGQDAYWTPPDGAVSDMDRLWAMLVQVPNDAALEARRRLHGVFSFNQVIGTINAPGYNAPAVEVENVCHALLTKVVRMDAIQARNWFAQSIFNVFKGVAKIFVSCIFLANAFRLLLSSSMRLIADKAEFSEPREAISNKLCELLTVFIREVFSSEMVKVKRAAIQQVTHNGILLKPQNTMGIFLNWLNWVFHDFLRFHTLIRYLNYSTINELHKLFRRAVIF